MTEQKPKSGTHVATTPNKRPLTEIEVLRGNLESEFSTTVTNYYRGNEQEAVRFKTAVVDYVRKTPKLLQCDRVSLLAAFVQLAQFRFMPSGVMGEAYVIPYGQEAKFQIGYQGLVTLLYRTKTVLAITSNIVYENDEFDYQEGLNPILIHKPVIGKPKGKEIAVYTVAQLEGGAKTFKVMSEADVMEIRALSKAKDKADSPWNSDKDPFKGMWKKTCLIQHSKFLPKTADFQLAVEKDMDGEGMERSNFDPGGPAVGKSFHAPQDFTDAETSQESSYKEPEIK